MLLLGRKLKERIIIPAFKMVIEIVEVKGKGVRLGITAPPSVAVYREELIQDGQKFEDVMKVNHNLRGQLQSATLAAQLLTRQINSGASEEELLDTVSSITRAATSGKGREVESKDNQQPLALIVEDDPNERELLAGMLRFSGVQVATASDGQHALDYLKNERKPDVVLLDMGLPTLQGAEVATRIKETTPGLKIFVISGQENRRMKTVDRWFQKPLNPEELLIELQQIIVG